MAKLIQMAVSGENVYPTFAYKIKTVTGSVSFSNDSYGVAQIDLTDSGWTPVAIVGFRASANTIVYRISYCEINGNTLSATVVNKSGSNETSTQTATFKILYLRTS